jgi:hypothetical protein
MTKLKLISRILLHIMIMITYYSCTWLSKGFGLASNGLNTLLESNELYTDKLVEEK